MKLIDLLNKIANGEIKEGTKCIKDGKIDVYTKEYYTMLNEEVEIIEEKQQQGRWKPRKGGHYWSIDTIGCYDNDEWVDDDADNWRYATKNVFKTKQDAEEYFEYKTALLEAEKPFVYGEFNFAIECDASAKKPYLGWCTRIMSQGQIYLGQDQDVARAFVDKWYKQILKYEFGIEE